MGLIIFTDIQSKYADPKLRVFRHQEFFSQNICTQYTKIQTHIIDIVNAQAINDIIWKAVFKVFIFQLIYTRSYNLTTLQNKLNTVKYSQIQSNIAHHT